MGSELEYQGQEFDRIMVDEATQLTEREFRLIGACLRGTGACPKQMFLTANPGGVGHFWFKRLFVDGHFNEGEDASEYRFIPATLDDNPFLLTATPDYARSLELLPEDVRRAHRYGDWEAAGGRFFTEFTPNMHVVNGFTIPQDWVHYRAFDYGLDMLACLWIAVSPEGIAYVYRELERSGLVVSEACKLIRELTSADEKIVANAAPPDIWSRTKDSGRTMAELFRLGGVTPNRAGNERVSGWMHVKELLRGRLLIFDSCSRLIECLGLIQTSPNNPNDCASTPHNLTHICDALRYFTALRYVNPMVDESDYELPDMVSYNGYNT
jgi:phage terminase large subunit